MADNNLQIIALTLPTVFDCMFTSPTALYLTDVIENKQRKEKKHDYVDNNDILPLLAVNESTRHSKTSHVKKIKNYVRITVENYSDQQFRKHFRLQRWTVEFLYQMFGSELEDANANIIKPGPCQLRGQINILMPLWTISNQETFRGICDRFGLGVGHGYRIFCHFVSVISKKLNNVIVWPKGSEFLRNLLGFQTLRVNAFPGVVGCVDGSYIPISGLKSENDSYCSRKKFRAIILQAICDHQKQFIDVFAGWPGSCHDARVWRNSQIYKNLKEEKNVFLPSDTHLLGDSAYPLNTYIIVPFKDNGHLTQKQKYFNKCLSSSRVVIENAFALLKSRFRRLRFLDMRCMPRATKVIITACILHNICIQQNDFMDDDEIELDNNIVGDNECENVEENINEGVNKRIRLADSVYENRL